MQAWRARAWMGLGMSSSVTLKKRMRHLSVEPMMADEPASPTCRGMLVSYLRQSALNAIGKVLQPERKVAPRQRNAVLHAVLVEDFACGLHEPQPCGAERRARRGMPAPPW